MEELLNLTKERADAVANGCILEKYALYTILNIEKPQSLTDSFEEIFAYAAGDMDDEGNTLKYKKIIIGPHKNEWIKASIKEFHKLFRERNTIVPIHYNDIPVHKRSFISYYNPQCKVKMRTTGPDYRVRGTMVETVTLANFTFLIIQNYIFY